MFDAVDHEILLQKLKYKFNFTDNALQWFRSYLTERSQSVCVNNVSSKSTLLSSGLPQGSKLGPKHFSLYLNSIGSIFKKYGLNQHIHADNIQICFTANSAAATETAISRCLKFVSAYMNENKIMCGCSVG